MDYIYPVTVRGKKLPVVIYVHGGGWVAGTKEARRLYCSLLAERDFFCVNIEYDLAPEKQFPYAVGQCFSAVKQFWSDASQLPVDLDRVAVAGESAGVFYAFYLAAAAKDPSLPEKLGLEAKLPKNYDVKAVFSNCGAPDLKLCAHTKFPDAALDLAALTGAEEADILAGTQDELLASISPLRYINKDFPRTLLMYGQMDALRTNTFSAKALFDRLGVPYELYRCTGLFYGQHTSNIIFKFKKAFSILEDVVTFLNRALQ